MQSVATYTEKQIKDIEIIQNFIHKNDKAGLVNYLMQQMQHQMQTGGFLDK